MAKTFKGARAPAKKPLAADKIDAFVKSGVGTDRPANAEPLSRLSVDIPSSLHTRFKVACAANRTKMTRELINFIEARTAEMEQST